MPPFLEVCQQPDHLGDCSWCQNDCLITYWETIFLFQTCQMSNMSNIEQNMSNIGQIQLYLRKQTMDRVGFGVKITV